MSRGGGRLVCGVALAAIAVAGRFTSAESATPAVRDDLELGALSTEVKDRWIALLHYRTDGDGWRSEVQQLEFFLADDGDIDPQREWTADREAFQEPVPPDVDTAAHAQCRFPARFAFMKQALRWSDRDVTTVDCPLVGAFQRMLSARSLSVVFASNYLANPASAFGHTMLYVGTSPQPGAKLADYAIGFEADTKGMPPLEYIPKGLQGELVAGFRVTRFYDRVQKYERQERRDVWLFPLKLSQADLDQLVRHVYELQPIAYRYGFFGANCAQKILALIHAVAPGYRLLPFDHAAILPSDVVRRLVSAIGLSGRPIYRPSLLGRYRNERNELSDKEREQLDEMISLRTVPVDAGPRVLSAAIAWSEIELPHRTFQRALESKEHPDVRWKRALLEALEVRADASRHGTSSDLPVVLPDWQPSQASLLEAHAGSRIGIRGGYRNGVANLALDLRWLLHDPLDPSAGYPAFSGLEVLRTEGGIDARGDGFLDEATGIRVAKLAPQDSERAALAWKVELGMRRLPYRDGQHLHAGIEIAAGVSSAVIGAHASLAVYALAGARPGAVLYDDHVRFGPIVTGTMGLMARLGPVRAQFQTESSLTLDSFALEPAATTTARVGVSRNLDLELQAAAARESLSAGIGFVLFH